MLTLLYLYLSGAIAQLGERLNGIQEVSGSIPLSSTISLRGVSMKNLILFSALTMLFSFPSYSSTMLPAEAASGQQIEEFLLESNKKESAAKGKSNYFGAGLTAGSTSGIGITNRYHHWSGLGYQLTIGAFGNPDFFVGSVGSQMTYTFASIDNARIYSLTGIGYFFNSQVNHSYSMCDWDSVEEREINCVNIPETVSYGAAFSFGVGLGIEVILWDTLGISLELPLSALLSVGTTSGFETLGVFPIPNASLVYYF